MVANCTGSSLIPCVNWSRMARLINIKVTNPPIVLASKDRT